MSKQPQQGSHPVCMKLALTWQRQKNAMTASISCRGFEYTPEKVGNVLLEGVF